MATPCRLGPARGVAGTEAGEFAVEDPDLVANMLYSLGLGGLQLARLGVMVKEGSPGVPVVTEIDVDAVKLDRRGRRPRYGRRG